MPLISEPLTELRLFTDVSLQDTVSTNHVSTSAKVPPIDRDNLCPMYWYPGTIGYSFSFTSLYSHAGFTEASHKASAPWDCFPRDLVYTNHLIATLMARYFVSHLLSLGRWFHNIYGYRFFSISLHGHALYSKPFHNASAAYWYVHT